MVKGTKTKKAKVVREETDYEIAFRTGEPVIRKGSHLTTTTYPDGNVELKWDDEALARDVRSAIASVVK